MKSFKYMADSEYEAYIAHIRKLQSDNARDNTHFKGKKHKLEPIEKIREHRKDMTGFHHTEETKKIISEHSKGNHYALGYHHTDDAKRRISENSWMRTEEAKKHFSERSKGRTWWTDGTSRKFCRDCPGDGWYRGIPRDAIEKRSQTMRDKGIWKQKQETE